jgi:protein CpxP
MKKIYFLLTLAIPLIGQAQTDPHKPKLTGEQHATLQAKKLQLALDLSKEQAVQIKKQREQLSKTKQKRGELNAEERYTLHLERIDRQIAMQSQMKTILNEEQYDAWRKIKSHQKHKTHRRDRLISRQRKDGGHRLHPN